MAKFVRSLLTIAEREDGIGPEVREIAKSQNDAASSTARAITNVNKRGSFHTFLTGSDYKNLGVIRREIATSTANIERLKAILDQTTNDADRAEINVQIEALEDNLTKVEDFVKENEDKFSLFGWFSKLFVK